MTSPTVKTCHECQVDRQLHICIQKPWTRDHGAETLSMTPCPPRHNYRPFTPGTHTNYSRGFVGVSARTRDLNRARCPMKKKRHLRDACTSNRFGLIGRPY